MPSLIFDLDGTLADSRQCILDSVRYAFDRIGFAKITFDSVRVTQQDLRKSYEETMEQNQIPFNDEELNQFITEYRWYHEHEGEAGLSLYEGVLETLDQLRPNFGLAVATTKHSMQALRVLNKLKIDHYFDHIQGTDPGMRYKPEPDILLHTLSALRRPSEKSAYVGDSIHDMHAAASMGMRRIGAAYGFAGDSQLIDHGPDWLIYDFRDLTGISYEILDRLNQSFAEGQRRLNSQ
ncbi:MAG: hypothetical protein COV44_04180 [Deltaproteobacteria bacterium CG11_big_fil_rev_8_21_14_0_20_45_16]|nr:MAG: hypothetical protein COV44_04180 [Deltaproteobacteria bacterium CG11_big_fil_rev_8_21_14_0_20_45_16]